MEALSGSAAGEVAVLVAAGQEAGADFAAAPVAAAPVIDDGAASDATRATDTTQAGDAEAAGTVKAVDLVKAVDTAKAVDLVKVDVADNADAGPTAGSAGDADRPRPRRRTRRQGRPPGRDPIWAHALVAFGALLVLLSSGLLVTERVLVSRYEGSVHKDTLLAPQARVSAEAQRTAVVGPLNFLLVGSDARADDPENGQRSDTTIIVHVPATMDRAYLVSIPRDLRVHIPPFEPTGFRGSHEKINGAFQYGGGGFGGVQLLSATLTELLGIQFDGAAIIDFTGFPKAVDQLGGVFMCVDVRTESVHIGFDKNGKFRAPYRGSDQTYRDPESTPKVYEPGCRTFKGWEALDYVRQRKTLPNGDYDRQRHQQQFLHAILFQAQERNLATNPIALDRFIRTIGDSLTVDANGVPLDDLAFALRHITPETLVGIEVPSQPDMIGGISYIIADSSAEDLYQAIRGDTLDAWVAANPTWVNQM